MSDLNIGKVIIDQTKTSQVTVNYADTSKPDTSIITSNRTQMTATVDSISTVFEVSKTYYFDADGGLVTTNQGYGTLGTTDSDGVLTVEIKQATLQDFRIEESESEYRVAEDIHFTAYVNYGNLPSIWAVYAQYSPDGITYEDIQSATVGGSGLANITGCLIPAGASGTIYLRARVGDVYSDPIEATVVTPEIVISAVDVTVDEAFTISGTCNLAKNLRISYAKDPYSSWTVVDNSVAVQPNGTWSVGGVVISETGNFRLKAEYIQDTVSMFSDTEDVVVASGELIIDDFESYANGTNLIAGGQWTTNNSSAFVASNTEKKSGSISGRTTSSSYGDIRLKKTFTQGNYNNKKLQIWVKFTNADATNGVNIVLSDGVTLRQSFAKAIVSVNTWSLVELSITYNGNIDNIEFQFSNRWGGYIYIDDIKIV
jgi:hypothetical protein